MPSSEVISRGLERGMMLRQIRARTLDGRAVETSDFRGRRNLLLIFAGEHGEHTALLAELGRRAAELQEEEAAVLIADTADDTNNVYGARAEDGRPIAALYISDRYGEIYFAAHQQLISADESLDWLRYINAQCPE